MDASLAREIDDDAMNTKHSSDARIALRTLEQLRDAGHQPHTVTVGAVTIGLYTSPAAWPTPGMEMGEPAEDDEPARPTAKAKPEPGIYEEHGADLFTALEDKGNEE